MSYIWIERIINTDVFFISEEEDQIPAGKIAAAVNVTESERKALDDVSYHWNEHQRILEHLFDRGQKIVPVNS